MLVRDGKTSTFSVDSAEVFGMELRQGDIIQTSSSTFLEISVTSIHASVQVAENTSFKCDADKTGEQVTGELYYGRVRAKVAKLAGSSTFRITTPTLVAGVRGTDFGCDVIAVRGSKAVASAATTTPAASAGTTPPAASVGSTTPILNRVFCFEGTVAVAETENAGVEPVLITKNEMVENVVASGAAAPVITPLVKSSLSDEVTTFWQARPFAEVAKVFPEGRIEEFSSRNLKIPAGASTTLIVLGTAACLGASWYSEHVDPDGVFVAPVYSAGIVMAGSGSILALISALLD